MVDQRPKRASARLEIAAFRSGREFRTWLVRHCAGSPGVWVRIYKKGSGVLTVTYSEEWIMKHDEALRIVPQDLWERVHRRQEEVSRKAAAQAYRGGRRPKYLLSGLLRCGMCGSNYVIRNRSEYGCSFHVNRGNAICKNDLGVKRRVIEQRLLDVVRRDLFTPEAIAYVVKRANAILQERAQESQRSLGDRKKIESDLSHAMSELDNIRQAIRQGLAADLTLRMLEETEARVRDLRAQLENPVAAQLHALRVLPRTKKHGCSTWTVCLGRTLTVLGKPWARSLVRLPSGLHLRVWLRSSAEM